MKSSIHKVWFGVYLLLFLLAASIFLRLLQFFSFENLFLFSRFYFWAVLFVMIFYALKIEKQKFLLYENRKYPFWKAILMGICAYFIIALGSLMISLSMKFLGFSEGTNETATALYSLLKNNPSLLVFTCITAGFTEELLMRGYLQPRLEKLYNSTWAGIFLSALIFGVLHAGWESIFQIIGTFWIGLVFAIFYYKFRNIKILIILHIIIDLVSLFAKTLINQ